MDSVTCKVRRASLDDGISFLPQLLDPFVLKLDSTISRTWFFLEIAVSLTALLAKVVEYEETLSHVLVLNLTANALDLILNTLLWPLLWHKDVVVEQLSSVIVLATFGKCVYFERRINGSSRRYGT